MNALAQEYKEEMLRPVIQEIPEQQSAEEEREVENLEGSPEEIPETTVEAAETEDAQDTTEEERSGREDEVEDLAVTTRFGRVVQ